MSWPSIEYSRTCDHGAIQTLPGFARWGPAVYGSTPSGRGSKIALVLHLLRALVRLDPRWRATADESAVTIRKSALGAPCLFLGKEQGPSLSFSHGGDRLWAAMSGTGRVGIDVAYPGEFAGAYPLARAFCMEELICLSSLCPTDTSLGAALVWSAKEASVKATGAGFNFLDPLEVRVGNPSVRKHGIFLQVSAGRPVSVWVRKEGQGWLSVAFA